MLTKQCTNCGQVKPLSEFPATNEPYHADGRKHRCNACTALYNQSYQADRRNRLVSKAEALEALSSFIVKKGRRPEEMTAYQDLTAANDEPLKVQRVEHLKGRVTAQIKRESR